MIIATLKIAQASLNSANSNLEMMELDNKLLDFGESKLIESINYLEQGFKELELNGR